MTFNCLFKGHTFIQHKNNINDGTWFVCIKCGCSKWRPLIKWRE